MSKLLEEFQEYLKKKNQYEHVLTLLYWDMKTCTPKLGQEGHVEALTHFSTEVFAMSTSEQMGEMLTELAKPAEYDALTDTWKFIVTRMKRDFDRNKRIPADTCRPRQRPAISGWMPKRNPTLACLLLICRR